MKNTPALPTPSLTGDIVELLNQEIRLGNLKPGDKLPSEKQLGLQFSFSRSVVREAVSHLKSEGTVAAQQGRGVFVNERGSRQAFRLDATSLDDAAGLEHVLELLVTTGSGGAGGGNPSAQRRPAPEHVSEGLMRAG